MPSVFFPAAKLKVECDKQWKRAKTLQSSVHQAHAVDHIGPQVADVLETLLALAPRKAAEVCNHRPPMSELAVHFPGMRQPGLDVLVKLSLCHKHDTENETCDLNNQTNHDKHHRDIDRQPPRGEADQNTDDGCEHAHPERPFLQSARLRVDAVIDQSLHTSIKPLEGQFLPRFGLRG
ncbi:hypothetical protein D3C72_1560360 [compost metagenome]